MLRVAIVDDEVRVREDLVTMLERFSREEGVALATSQYASGEEFLASGALEDIVLLDIEMAELDGMNTAHRLRAMGVTSEIVFVTNMAQYAINGYEVGAIDFVVKPVRYPSFAFKLRRVVEAASRKRAARITVSTRDGELRHLNTADITYVEVIRHKLIYHTTQGTLETWDSLKNACSMLEPFGFALCNACYLVNLAKVVGVGQDMVTVEGGDELKMSRGRKKEFIDKLTRPTGG